MKLEELNTQIRLALDSVTSLVFIKDAESRYIYANKQTLELFECSEEELSAIRDHDVFTKETAEKLRETDLKVLSGLKTDQEISIIDVDGEEAVYLEVKTPIFDKVNPDKVIGILCLSTDITDRKQNENKIRALVNKDSLTSLANRRFLFEQLEYSMKNSQRHSYFSAIVFIDLDKFKAVNDIYGHAIGDSLLQTTAMRLKSCTRDCDTTARIGGDEFVLLLDNIGKNQVETRRFVVSLVERLKSSLLEPYFICGQYIDASISFGVQVFKGDEQSAEKILSDADKKMYQQKAEKNN